MGEAVWKYFHNTSGSTIKEICGHTDVKSSPINSEFIDKSVWYTKSALDRFVENELNLQLVDYGSDMSENALYKAVAAEIRSLRCKELIVDLRRTKKKNKGVGIWRINGMTSIVPILAARDMRKEDYSSRGQLHEVFAREKQNIFREKLMREYNKKCIFCKFDLENYMIGAHIVPYSKMQKEDPTNVMNPSNGLLLCRMCDYAFELCDIILQDDLGVELSYTIQDSSNDTVKKWRESIVPEIQIKNNARYPPDTRYIQWKRELCKIKLKNAKQSITNS